MSWIPGWELITSANSGSNFYFWAGIAALLALGIFEVFSHRYTERKDELVAHQQDETQRRHDERRRRVSKRGLWRACKVASRPGGRRQSAGMVAMR
jgi:hypothetical protein